MLGVNENTNYKTIGETIPIRLFLGGFDLTPTFREVNKRFSTRYYLSLVLIDEGKSFHHALEPLKFTFSQMRDVTLNNLRLSYIGKLQKD
jgi:hypothetical protein